MRDSQIYRKAAEALFTRKAWLSCVAIARLVGKEWYDHPPQTVKFAEVFKPPFATDGGDTGWWWGKQTPQAQEQRILALLLMSEIAKDEEAHADAN